MVRPDIRTPGTIALLQSAALDGAIAGIDEAMFAAGGHQYVIDGGGIFYRHMQLIAEFADIGDAQRPDRAAGDADGLHLAEGECGVRNVGRGHGLQYLARFRSHQRQHGIGGGHIHQLGMHFGRNIAGDPIEVMRGKAGARSDVEFVLGNAGNGDVAFDAAAVVQHLGIGQGADRLGDVIGSNPRNRRLGIPALQHEFREGSLVENDGRFAHGLMFPADSIEPVLTAVGVDILRLLAGEEIGKPVRPLPAELFAEAGTLCLQPVVERRLAAGTAAGMLLEGPGHGVVLAIGLQRADTHPVGVEMRAAEAPDIDRPEIVRRLALGDPFGERHARPAGRSNAEGVEAGADEEIPQLRRLAENEIAVGRKALRPAKQLLDAGRLQRRHAHQRLFHDLLEMIEIAVEQRVMEIPRDAVECPWDGIGLIAAHDQPADLFLVVGQPVGIAQSRQVGGHAEGFGDEILMLDRDEWHVDAEAGGEAPRPLPGADDDALAFDAASLRNDGADPALVDLQVENLGILEDRDAAHAGAFRQRLGDVGRIGLAIGRQEGSADEIVDIHQRPEIESLLGRQQMHLQAKGLRRRRLPLHLRPALLVAGETQAAIHLPAGGKPSLGLELLVEIDGVAKHLSDIGAGAQLADEAGGMECGPRGQLLALQKHGIGEAELAEMVGGRAADDAAADDDGLCGSRQVLHRVTSRLAKILPGTFEAPEIFSCIGRIIEIDVGMDFRNHAPHRLAQERGAFHRPIAPAQIVADGSLIVSLQHCLFLRLGKFIVGGKAAKIEKRRVEAGIIPIDQPQPLAVIEEIRRQQVVMAEGDLEGTGFAFEPVGDLEKGMQQRLVATAASLQESRIIPDHMKDPEDRRRSAKVPGDFPMTGSDERHDPAHHGWISYIIGR